MEVLTTSSTMAQIFNKWSPGSINIAINVVFLGGGCLRGPADHHLACSFEIDELN